MEMESLEGRKDAEREPGHGCAEEAKEMQRRSREKEDASRWDGGNGQDERNFTARWIRVA